MNIKKITIIGAVVAVLLGGLAMASATAPKKTDTPKPTVKYEKVGRQPTMTAKYPSYNQPINEVVTVAEPAPATLELVPPPQELPRVNENNRLVSATPMAPATTMHTYTPNSQIPSVAYQQAQIPQTSTLKETKTASTVAKTQGKMASAEKHKPVFAYTRLLNFSPHPQEEVFLKDKPLILNGKKHHISVKYKEDWNVLSDDEGHLKALGFVISIFENGKVIRTLNIPSARLDPKKISRGQILGLAEVAPYKFRIAVDSFSVKNKGISELTFRFEMTQ